MALSVYDDDIFNTFAGFYLEQTSALKGWDAVKQKATIALSACLSFVKWIPQVDKERLLEKKHWEDEATYLKRFELFFRDNSNMRHYAVWDDKLEEAKIDEDDEDEDEDEDDKVIIFDL